MGAFQTNMVMLKSVLLLSFVPAFWCLPQQPKFNEAPLTGTEALASTRASDYRAAFELLRNQEVLDHSSRQNWRAALRRVGAGAGSGSSSGSGSGSGSSSSSSSTSAPTAAPTTATTTAPTTAPTTSTTATVTQAITFTLSGGASSYTGDIKSTYEFGYGKQVGVATCPSTGCSYLTGCSVSSSAANSRRQAVTITFVVSIDEATATVTLASVNSAAANTTPSTLTSHINDAASAQSVSIGTVTVTNVGTPTMTQSQATQAGSSSDDNTGVIVGAVVGGVGGAALIGGGIAFFVMKKNSAAMVNPTEPASTTQVVAMK